jgi:hypothetical protein
MPEFPKARRPWTASFASAKFKIEIHQQKWSPAKSMLKTLMEIEVLQRKPFQNS